jgi:cysteine desulfurase
MHTFGGQLHRQIEEARAKVAALIGADPEEIIFTSCGTESDNTALMSAVELQPGRRHIVTTRMEHPAVLSFCRHLARKGHRVTYLPVDHLGRLDLDAFRKAVDDETAVVSVMYANNETGVVFSIGEIGQLLREWKVLFHTDAVQAAGKLPLNVKCCSLTCSPSPATSSMRPKGSAPSTFGKARDSIPLSSTGARSTAGGPRLPAPGPAGASAARALP